jgi:hypothetical protein
VISRIWIVLSRIQSLYRIKMIYVLLFILFCLTFLSKNSDVGLSLFDSLSKVDFELSIVRKLVKGGL